MKAKTSGRALMASVRHNLLQVGRQGVYGPLQIDNGVCDFDSHTHYSMTVSRLCPCLTLSGFNEPNTRLLINNEYMKTCDINLVKI